MIRYWLPGADTKNLAGEVVKTAREVGPYIAQIMRECFREVSDAEVIEYVQRMHEGLEPTRIVRD